MSVREHATSHNVKRLATRFLGVLTYLLSLTRWTLPRQGQPLRLRPRHEMHPLAYLDGLRGVCALIIMTGHATHKTWKWIPPAITDIPWFQWPTRGGHPSVLVFFWISGYTSTYRLCGMMQTKRLDQFFDTLTSSTFRRYMRLFLPPIPVILLVAIAVKAGIAVAPQAQLDWLGKKNLIFFWIWDSWRLIDPFVPVAHFHNGASGSKLIEPLWSLATEFRSSMIMYGFCAATCRFSTRARKRLILCMLPLIASYEASWSVMAFFGMWCSECRQEKRYQKGSEKPQPTRSDTIGSSHVDLELSEKRHSTPSRFSWSHVRSTSTGMHRNQTRRNIGLLIMFLYSFVILQNPSDIKESKQFPHNYINSLIPKDWNDMSKMHTNLIPGVLLLLWPLDQLTALQRPLVSPFAQYLGELSFGIYVVHKPMIWVTFVPRYTHWAEKYWAPDSPYHIFWGVFPGWLMLALSVLWAAEGFRQIDNQVPRLCKWLEDRLFEKW